MTRTERDPVSDGARPSGRRFGVMLYPDASPRELVERARWVEELGFDHVVLPDHSGDLRDLTGTWHDVWVVLTAIAVGTSRVRVGTMVANQILRPPSQTARLAMSVDHVSGGRLELGIGAGLFPWDHHSVGEPFWSPQERMRRLRDYVAVVDGVLRAEQPTFGYRGSSLWADAVPTAPGCVQSPRVPITLGGQSPTVLRIAASWADGWNTHGPPGACAETVLRATAEQIRRLDRLIERAGRNPDDVRRGYTIFGPWDPRAGRHTYEEVFERFAGVGISDFVLDWPPPAGRDEFVRVASDVLPELRRTA